MKTCIGFVTYGNLDFTKLCVNAIRETVTKDYDLYAVVGKPGDDETSIWMIGEGIKHTRHSTVNKGFPASINDIYDHAWGVMGADALIIIGNDVVPYPGAIDALIECAETTDWEWVCSSQFDSKSLVSMYPEAAKYFHGGNLLFSDFGSTPWKLHNHVREPHVSHNSFPDTHNLALFRRSVFEKIGYIDVSFYPAYFSDNDYVRRALVSGIAGCALSHSVYFHFWSRTIHQGSGGSNNHFFDLNQKFYDTKWGGGRSGNEKWTVPFNGKPHRLSGKVTLPAVVNITDRHQEDEITKYWRNA